MGAYTGAATRATYSRRPAVPGVDPIHSKRDPGTDLDPFQPVVADGPGGPGTVWEEAPEWEPQTKHPTRATLKTTHWWPMPPMAPVGVPDGATAKQLTQSGINRRNAVHSFADVIPNSSRLVKPAGLGKVVEWLVGNAPRDAGKGTGDMPWLGNGKNAYDQTNAPTVVYSGDEANVGRYRLGRTLKSFGINLRPTAKIGQDIFMRAAEEKHPELNHGREQVKNPTPFSSGFLRGENNEPIAQWRHPSSFALPSTTNVTDRTMLVNGVTGNPEFDDDDSSGYL